MIKILGKVPEKVYVACSGGPDSMAILDFLIRGKRDVTVAHFNHDTPFGRFAENFVKGYCKDNSIELVIGNIQREKYAWHVQACDVIQRRHLKVGCVKRDRHAWHVQGCGNVQR